MNFVPLQVLSTYSLLQSTTTITELVQEAKQRGYQSLALTDMNVLYGAVDFYNAATKAGIHPIIGLTLETAGLTSDTTFPIVLLAKDQQGYQNLMRLSTAYQTKQPNTSLDFTSLLSLLPHLFVILPANGEFMTLLKNGQQADAIKYIQLLKKACDADSLLIAINTQLDTILRATLVDFSEQQAIKLVTMNRVGYLNSEDHFALEVLRSIDRGDKFNHPLALADQKGTHWLKPMQEVMTDYEKVQLDEAIFQTQWVSDHCNVQFEFKAPVLPHFVNDQNLSSAQYLKQLCIDGLRHKQMAPNVALTAYQQRLKTELNTIHEMGFDDYFLIIADVMQFAHQAKITTGPGRGSAAGSLVAYALSITDVDPLRYQLLFERFLNLQRAQMPDIDLDIPDDRREEVLQYVHNKYGHDRVAQIITFGTLAAKQVIRDVGRVFGLTTTAQAAWSKAIPNQLHISLQQAYQDSQRLQNMVKDNQTNQLLFQTALRLEGLPRHYSTHAAGIVLSDQSLDQIVPLQDGSDGLLMTQFPKDTVEALGLLKMDFLGLRNLTIMDRTLKLIHQKEQQFDIKQINLEDPQTLGLFQAGDTNGVFQFESSGIKNVLRNLHPDNFELIVAVNALYRPGPMENIDQFIKRKNGQEPIEYPDSSLEPILKPTYGILVYQEQVMQVASQMAGFSLGEADLLRRAMSKKKTATMEQMRSKFVTGAEQNGYAHQVAEQVFDYIDRFANYGFNRSHAVAYSKMAFEMAYLKVHFPECFFPSLLNSVVNNPAKIKIYLVEAKQHGVQVVGPQINHSQAQFVTVDQQIIFGFSSIKGLRRDFVQEILQERETNGSFKNLTNFIQRIDVKWRKPDYLEPLIYTGAFDGLGYNRAELIEALPKLLDSIELTGASLSLFEELAPTIEPRSEFSLEQRLSFEEQYLGAYLSGHPVSQYQLLADRQQVSQIATLQANQTVTILLFVNHVKTIRTKRGDQMAFVSGSDQTAAIDVTVFPNLYKQVAELLVKNKVLLISGQVETNRGLQVVAKKIVDAKVASQKIQRPAKQRWVLRIDEHHQQNEVDQRLRNFLKQHPGQVPVVLFYPTTDQKIMLEKEFWLSDDQTLKHQLATIIGSQNVVLQKLPLRKD